jgi:hypothetical protein
MSYKSPAFTPKTVGCTQNALQVELHQLSKDIIRKARVSQNACDLFSVPRHYHGMQN